MKAEGIMGSFYKQTTVFFFGIFLYGKVAAGNAPLPLGIVFEQGTAEVQTAFKHALLTFTPLNITSNPRDLYRFQAYVDTINTADAFKLSKLICNQFSRGIFAMVGSMNAESFHTYHAFANTFHMPIITPWYPVKDQILGKGNGRRNDLADYATRLRPDFNQVIAETIRHYGWKEIIYLYSSNEGLMRLQTLFYRTAVSDHIIKLKVVKKIIQAKDAIQVLKDIEAAERFSPKYVLLDCPISLAQEIIVSHVRDVQLGRRTYHYLLAGMAFDEHWDNSVLEYTAVNITGFRMVDPGRRYVQEFLHKWSSLDTAQFPGAGKTSISASAALMYDAMLIIKEAFTDILMDNPFALKHYGVESACDSGSDFLDDVRPFEYGQLVNQHLRRVQTEGLTGNIQFHENGTRKYFTVDVIEMRTNSTKVKIGQWSDYGGFKAENFNSHSQKTQIDKEKVYVVSGILEEPYLMRKQASTKNQGDKDAFEGYMKDLAEMVFNRLDLKYRIQLVKDGRYGAKTPTNFGDSWNGMIGELVRQEVDVAIAPLTITSDRERVVEFTKPFLTQGISIMVYKPRKAYQGLFSFMAPLSDFVWLSFIGAYLAVSGALYLIYKLSTAHQRAAAAQRMTDQYNLKYTTGGGGQGYMNQHQQYNHHHHHTHHEKLPMNPSNSIPSSGGGTAPLSITLSSVLWMSFAILSRQSRGIHFPTRSLAARLVSAAWWLFTIILISMYTGNYIAIRMRNRVASSIRTPWDLDQSGIDYGTLVDGSTYEFFKNSETQVYKAIYEHLNGPHQLNVRSYEDGVNMVRQKRGKYAFILESTKNEYMSNKRPCNTMKVGPDLSEINYGIALPVGSPLTQKVNLEILRLKESGVLRQLEEKWWINLAECRIAKSLEEMEYSGANDELSLTSMAGIFYVLIVGMTLAIFVSFIEYCCSPKPKPPSTNTNSNNKKNCVEGMNQRNPNLILGTVPNDFRDLPSD